MQTVLDLVKLVIGTLVLVWLVLVHAARRRPDNPWLQKFVLPDYRTEEQKRRAAKRANAMAGIEMIGMGLALVPLYLLSTVMAFFASPNPVILALTGIASVILIVVGIRTIVKSISS